MLWLIYKPKYMHSSNINVCQARNKRFNSNAEENAKVLVIHEDV